MTKLIAFTVGLIIALFAAIDIDASDGITHHLPGYVHHAPLD